MKLRILTLLPFLFMGGVFLWQFGLGLLIGREAGFLLYGPAGLFPVAILGAPWFLWLMPEGQQLDLTYPAVLGWYAIRFHAAVFISLMINATIVAVVIEGIGRLVQRKGDRSISFGK